MKIYIFTSTFGMRTAASKQFGSQKHLGILTGSEEFSYIFKNKSIEKSIVILIDYTYI